MKLDKAYFKICIFVLTSILVPALVQFISDEYLNFTFTENKFVSFLLYCLFFVIATILILCAIKLIIFLFTQRDNYDETNIKIKSICKSYTFLGKEGPTKMFCLPNSNKENHDDQTRYVGEKNEKRNNVIYYSFSAKTYLNWIDYIYLTFIKKIKDVLKCKVVICLHFPDDIKECKIEKGFNTDPNKFLDDYRKTCEYFSNLIKIIVGEDVIIKTENQVYKENLKIYAEDFHNIYVSTTLYYAHRIGDLNDEGKEYTYNDFKRRSSHIESVFPIWMMSKRNMKHGRTFVIDNKLSQELWEMNPLHTIRKSNKIYFIEVASLCYPSGERIDVHTKENVINLTDKVDVLVSKLSRTDNEIKQMIISLMDEDYLSMKDYHVPSVDDIDNKILKLFSTIAEKYKLYDYEQSLEKYKIDEE